MEEQVEQARAGPVAGASGRLTRLRLVLQLSGTEPRPPNEANHRGHADQGGTLEIRLRLVTRAAVAIGARRPGESAEIDRMLERFRALGVCFRRGELVAHKAMAGVAAIR